MTGATKLVLVGVTALAAACGSAPEVKPPKEPASVPTAAFAEVVPPVDASVDVPGSLSKSGAKAPGSTGAKAEPKAEDLKPSFTRALVEIDSRQGTNHGNVLHMMLRQLDQKAMGVVESYEQAASFVVAPVRDESVLTIQPVFPGKRLTLAVTGDSKKKLVAYFFFTNPGQNWRVELPRPLPSRVSIALGNDQVDSLKGAR